MDKNNFQNTIPVIDCKNVTVKYNTGNIALKNISCVLQDKYIAIIGNNGSGKSTFAQCLCGLQKTKTGHITINGKHIQSYKNNIWKEINMTFQTPDQQIIMPSVKDEIEFALNNLKMPSTHIDEIRENILSKLEVSEDFPCHSLSVGKKRLLCLLCIISIQPKILILDEPTTFLDRKNKIEIFDIVFSLPQQIIIITHDTELIQKMNYALCFDNTTIVNRGTSQKVLQYYTSM